MFHSDIAATYAGIGSRRTPPRVLDVMRALADRLACDGHTLRSGAAEGADTAFERGARDAGGSIELFLPWRSYGARDEGVRLREPLREASLIASLRHPAWARCSSAVRRLHARNAHIVLGAQLDDPVAVVVCWTPGALGGGGTGQALRIARHLGVPVLDLADERVMRRALEWIG